MDAASLDLVRGSGDEPAADELVAAVAAARVSGEPVEVLERTTPTERHVALPDGSVRLEAHAVPQRVRKPSGWAPVDTTLSVVDGRVAPAASVLDVSFSAGGDAELVILVDQGRRLGLSWPRPLPRPVLAGDTAVYPDVLPGVDLLVRAEPDSFSQVLRVRTRKAAANPELARIAWQVTTTDGAVLRQSDSGEVRVVDEDSGEVVFRSPESVMWAAPPQPDPQVLQLERQLGESLRLNAEPGPSRVAEMPVQVGDDEIAVIPDADILTDPETVFPVMIDPPFDKSPANWAPVFNARPNDSWPSGSSQPRDQVRVGYLNWPQCGSWCGVWRSHLRFSISQMSGQDLVDNPTFRIMLDHSASCEDTPVELWRTHSIGSSGDVSWNDMSSKWSTNFGSRDASANEGICPEPDEGVEWSTSTMRSKLQGAMNSGNSTFTFGLRAPNESDKQQWKRFHTGSAKLVATYNLPPDKPTDLAISADCYLSCDEPAMVRSRQPQLSATVSDPNGGPLEQVRFQVRNESRSSVVASGSRSNVPGGSTVSWTPGSNLPQEETFHFRVRARDDHGWGSWSSYFTFTVDTNPPTTPTVSSGLYLHKDTSTWNGGVGQAGQFTFDPNGSDDVVEYTYRWLDGGQTALPATAGEALTAAIAPPGDLEQVLQVRSVDQAGNISGWVSYPFYVRPQPADVAYWQFDEAAGATAAPTTGDATYTGTLNGGATWADSEISQFDPESSGTAVHLDGQDGYVEMPRTLSTNHAAGFTVTAWVNPDELASYHAVVAQSGQNATMFLVYYKPETDQWCLRVNGADDSEADRAWACSTATPQVGEWTHLAAAYDRPAGKIRLWVDGGPNNGEPVPGTVTEVDAPEGIWAANGSFTVGRSTHSNFWSGRIDEVRAHQRVLGEFEIQHTFLQCRYGSCPQVSEPDEPTLVGRWDLDEGAGAVAADASGLGNDAGLFGDAEWVADGYDGTSAVSFDGGESGYLETDGPVLMTDQSFTVSAWVRLRDRDSWQTVLSQAGEYMSPFRLGYRKSHDKWCLGVRTADAPRGSSSTSYACGPSPQLGVWTHLVGVYDSGAAQLRLYVDGQLAGTADHTTPWHADGPFGIGRNWYTDENGPPGPRDWFGGEIDLVRAYQTALGESQVWAMFMGSEPW